jgi:hypothetical protein
MLRMDSELLEAELSEIELSEAELLEVVVEAVLETLLILFILEPDSDLVLFSDLAFVLLLLLHVVLSFSLSFSRSFSLSVVPKKIFNERSRTGFITKLKIGEGTQLRELEFRDGELEFREDEEDDADDDKDDSFPSASDFLCESLRRASPRTSPLFPSISVVLLALMLLSLLFALLSNLRLVSSLLFLPFPRALMPSLRSCFATDPVCSPSSCRSTVCIPPVPLPRRSGVEQTVVKDSTELRETRLVFLRIRGVALRPLLGD